MEFILLIAIRLVQACVDVLSSNGWLCPALAAMEVSQMLAQSMWNKASYLKQIPHFTNEIIQRCKDNGIESIFDLIEMDDQARLDMLQIASSSKLNEIAHFCNKYPNVEVSYELVSEQSGKGSDEQKAEKRRKVVSTEGRRRVYGPNDTCMLVVELQRDDDGSDELSVASAHFPRPREEGWWLVVGDAKTNSLLSIKRLTLRSRSSVQMEFNAPSQPGQYSYELFFMSDSYLGCDQEYKIEFDVAETNYD